MKSSDLYNKILQLTLKNDPRVWWREYPPKFIDQDGVIPVVGVKMNLKNIFAIKDNEIGLYVHIPFCISRCRYCKFYSGLYKSSQEVDRYLDAIESELILYNVDFKKTPLDSIYIGGGTPTILNNKQWQRLFGIINHFFVLKNKIQITTEGTPVTSTYSKLKLLKELGVNRFTIGAQSFDESVLRKAGRDHTVKDIYRSYYNARKADIQTVNLDMMLGLVGENQNSYNLMFQGISDLKPDCASILYLDIGYLIDPKYNKQAKMNEFLTDKEKRLGIFYDLLSVLDKLGYEQSQGSSESIFILKGRQDAANLNLVNRLKLGYTFGVGVAAESSLGSYKYRITPDKERYFNDVENGKLPRFMGSKLTKDEHVRRYFVYNFLHQGKINKEIFERRFGENTKKLISKKFSNLVKDKRIFDAGKDIIFLLGFKSIKDSGRYFHENRSSSAKNYYNRLSRKFIFCLKYFYSPKIINIYRNHFKKG